MGLAHNMLKSTPDGINVENDKIRAMLQGGVDELFEASRASVNREQTCSLIREVCAQYGHIV